MKGKLGQVTWILIALATVWFVCPAIVEARGCGGGGGGRGGGRGGGGGGCGGGRARPGPSAPGGLGGTSGESDSGRSDRPSDAENRRVRVTWKHFRLAIPAEAGYAEAAGPLADVVDRAVRQEAAGRAPAFVLIVDEEDEKRNAAVDKILSTEKVAIALKRFVCLKASVESIPDEEMREEVRRRAPLVYTFDPAGERVSLLQGRRTGSKSSLFAEVERAFGKSFALSLSKYTRTALTILDRLDRIAGERARIFAKLENARGSKQASLERELERLDDLEEKTLDEQDALVEACALRPEFIAEESEAK